MLANLFWQEANSGRAAFLLDPHGQLAKFAIDCVPPRRIRKTIYLDVTDEAFPVAFNPLYNVPERLRDVRTANLVQAIKSVWGDLSWGPRLEHVLYNAIRALLDAGNATILGIARMIEDETYRKKILTQVRDPQVRKFWTVTFYTYLEDGPQAFTSVLNKVEQLTNSTVMRNILGQSKTSFDPRHLMDNNYLFIVNLSKGAIGDEHANLLGSLLISSFGTAAMSRAALHPSDCKHFAMIIDEFQNFTTDALPSLLAEVRKYKISMILAHQYLSQLSETVRHAVLGIIGTIILFRVGGEDARVFANHFADYPLEHYLDTGNFRAHTRLMRYGSPSNTMELATLPEPKKHGNARKVISLTRNNFARPRARVEDRINRFMNAQLNVGKKPAAHKKRGRV